MKILLQNVEIRINIKKYYLKEDRNYTQDNQGGLDQFEDQAQESKMREEQKIIVFWAPHVISPNVLKYYILFKIMKSMMQMEIILQDNKGKKIILTEERRYKNSRVQLNIGIKYFGLGVQRNFKYLYNQYNQQQNYMNNEHWKDLKLTYYFQRKDPSKFQQVDLIKKYCQGFNYVVSETMLQKLTLFKENKDVKIKDRWRLSQKICLTYWIQVRVEWRNFIKEKTSFQKNMDYQYLIKGRIKNFERKEYIQSYSVFIKLMLRFMRDWLNQLEIFLKHIQYYDCLEDQKLFKFAVRLVQNLDNIVQIS
ncbi:unnamed protein product [Paramecium pentaurelia]|uniref:Uncharacterized protein n=1 Tax=Paramecium pentaurelia TaxID=43138 RepID=A0A8S1YPT3_9CILI|nr:unnamed protein product [Paramecium pentaurelia]